jgi:anaerobic selenocysteine-containing dehydrogenase
MSGHPSGDLIEVESCQGATVVARGTVSVGAALTVEVPVGAVQIYVDGVQVGAVNEGVPTDGPHDPPWAG